MLPRVYRHLYDYEDAAGGPDTGTPRYILLLVATQFTMAMSTAVMLSSSALTLVDQHGMSPSELGYIWSASTAIGVAVMLWTARVDEARAGKDVNDLKSTVYVKMPTSMHENLARFTRDKTPRTDVCMNREKVF